MRLAANNGKCWEKLYARGLPQARVFIVLPPLCPRIAVHARMHKYIQVAASQRSNMQLCTHQECATATAAAAGSAAFIVLPLLQVLLLHYMLHI